MDPYWTIWEHVDPNGSIWTILDQIWLLSTYCRTECSALTTQNGVLNTHSGRSIRTGWEVHRFSSNRQPWTYGKWTPDIWENVKKTLEIPEIILEMGNDPIMARKWSEKYRKWDMIWSWEMIQKVWKIGNDPIMGNDPKILKMINIPIMGMIQQLWKIGNDPKNIGNGKWSDQVKWSEKVLCTKYSVLSTQY